jgi:starvation-inducible DNA-binding protein
MFASHTDLPISTREKVIAMLQAHLFDCLDLLTQVKQASWNVKGPHFLAARKVFGALAQLIQRHCSVLAGRVTSLGGRADGTARTVARSSRLSEFPLTLEDGMGCVAAVADRLSIINKGFRASIPHAIQDGDAVTAHLITGICQANDKHLGFLDAHLQADR